MFSCKFSFAGKFGGWGLVGFVILVSLLGFGEALSGDYCYQGRSRYPLRELPNERFADPQSHSYDPELFLRPSVRFSPQ